MIVLRKRAASGAASLLASLARRLRWLASATEAAQSQLPLPFDEDDEAGASDEEPGLALAAPGLTDVDAERRMLQRLIDLAGEVVASDSKPRALARLLRRVREPAIVFTEYRDTLKHLADVLRGDRTVTTIHGGMDRAARAAAVGAFNRGEANLLLATDAAAHGLNLQSRCRLIVSLELPWNPVRLEQRIGRVDRIGQRRTVHAIHLVARHTGEEEVLARLAVRIERVRKDLGPAADPLGIPSEAEVTEAVFARRPSELHLPATVPRRPESTGEPSDRRTASELVVALPARGGGTRRGCAPATAARTDRPPTPVVGRRVGRSRSLGAVVHRPPVAECGARGWRHRSSRRVRCAGRDLRNRDRRRAWRFARTSPHADPVDGTAAGAWAS